MKAFWNLSANKWYVRANGLFYDKFKMFKFQRFYALKLKLKPLGNILKRRRFKLLSSQEVPCIKNCSLPVLKP